MHSINYVVLLVLVTAHLVYPMDAMAVLVVNLVVLMLIVLVIVTRWLVLLGLMDVITAHQEKPVVM